MERFAIIGLGRFGSRLARNLSAKGAEVIAIDQDRRIVEELRDQVTLAVALDATDEQALRLQGVDQVDCAVVCMGHDFEANALSTVLLKNLRVNKVISRSANDMQARILSRIGADSVVNPEDESSDRWTNKLLSPFIIDHVEMGEGYAIVQMPTPEAWRGKTLSELDLRNKHNVTIVAIKRRTPSASASGAEEVEERVVDLPQPSSRLTSEDVLVIAGFDKDIRRLPN
jgi:trk system potassium uptake protein TrkA